MILRDPAEREDMRRLIDVTADLIAPDAAFVEQITGVGDTPAARAFSMVAHGDWASYHAAIERGVDPWPVERIAALKHRLAEEPK